MCSSPGSIGSLHAEYYRDMGSCRARGLFRFKALAAIVQDHKRCNSVQHEASCFSFNLVRCCRYWQENGFAAIVAARLVNLAALAFTIAMAGFLLLVVNFSGLKDPCLHDNKCDIADAALYKHPLAHGSAFSTMFKLSFLGIFSLYWLWSAAVSAVEIWYAHPQASATNSVCLL